MKDEEDDIANVKNGERSFFRRLMDFQYHEGLPSCPYRLCRYIDGQTDDFILDDDDRRKRK